MSGALGEYMLADARLVGHKPPSLTMKEAAALPLVSITAWESLIDRAKIEPGQRVLVHAGAGGVGHIGIQLAKQAGCVVYTTISSTEKEMVAKELGADYCINYKEKTAEEYTKEHTGGEGFDVIFDTVGEDNLANTFQAAKVSSNIVTIAGRTTQDLSLLHAKGLTLHMVLMLLPMIKGVGIEHHGDILTRLNRMVERKQIRPYLDSEEFKFTEIAKAHQKLQYENTIGKIALVSDF
jgi:NADPH2:quinone reductase